MKNLTNSEKTDEPLLEAVIYNEDGVLRNAFVGHVLEQLEAGDSEQLLSTINPLHGSELGDLLEALNSEQRKKLVELTAGKFDLAALTEVDEAIRLGIVNALPNEQIAERAAHAPKGFLDGCIFYSRVW